MPSPSDDVTVLLDAWSAGDGSALAELMEVVQADLRKIADRAFRRERPGHTLQPTALVNELFIKLSDQRQVRWQDRDEFFAVAATMMRRILVDHARRHDARKRGGDVVKIPLDEALGLPAGSTVEVRALADALIDLERRSSRQSRIVELRVLVGLTLEEVAEVERISLSTVLREWNAARLFLRQQFGT